MGRRYEGRHRLPREEPGTASTAQGQPEAGIEPDEDKPEQPDKLVTGAEALEEQQQNPDLDDNNGARP